MGTMGGHEMSLPAMQWPGAVVAAPAVVATWIGGNDVAKSICTVEGCAKAAGSVRGWCVMHYTRWKRHGQTGPAAPVKVYGAFDRCTVTGCLRVPRGHGLCNAHRLRLMRRGTLAADVDVKERLDAWSLFWSKVDKDAGSGCWLWMACTNRGGYGVFTSKEYGRARLAHRVAYGMSVGPIPDGLTLDHLCVNPPCVNPVHMEPVTLAENRARAYRRRIA